MMSGNSKSNFLTHVSLISPYFSGRKSMVISSARQYIAASHGEREQSTQKRIRVGAFDDRVKHTCPQSRFPLDKGHKLLTVVRKNPQAVMKPFKSCPFQDRTHFITQMAQSLGNIE